jgi:N-acetylglutamate synthase-like GNAT family acetyltransferase
MRWFIRDYHDDDLEAVVRLLDATSAHQRSVFGLSEVIAALRGDQPAVVAQRDDEVVGVVVSVVSGDRAWVARLAIAEEWRGQGMASALLLGLERALDDQRVRVLSYVLPEEEQLADGLANAGFARRPAVAYFDKVVPVSRGRRTPRRAWRACSRSAVDDLAGCTGERFHRAAVRTADCPKCARHGVRRPGPSCSVLPAPEDLARAIASRLTLSSSAC